MNGAGDFSAELRKTTVGVGLPHGTLMCLLVTRLCPSFPAHALPARHTRVRLLHLALDPTPHCNHCCAAGA